MYFLRVVFELFMGQKSLNLKKYTQASALKSCIISRFYQNRLPLKIQTVNVKEKIAFKLTVYRIGAIRVLGMYDFGEREKKMHWK